MKRKMKACNIACTMSAIAVLVLFINAGLANKSSVVSAFLLLPCVAIYLYCDAQRTKARENNYKKNSR